jgi:putative SOS response-associated peptidase YedK
VCGRFTQAYTWAEIDVFLSVIGPARNLRPRYNIAPTTQIDVLRSSEQGRQLVPMIWGLVPSWRKKPLNELPSTFNARAETVAEKPMFRSAFKARRCIVPASGFYEWTGKPGSKTPHYFTAHDSRPLAFAGLWEHWRDPEKEEKIASVTIIVGPANDWMRPFHDRMPVILDWTDAVAWMSGECARELLRLPPENSLREWTVTARVNRSGVGEDDPTLIEPLLVVSLGARPMRELSWEQLLLIVTRLH